MIFVLFKNVWLEWVVPLWYGIILYILCFPSCWSSGAQDFWGCLLFYYQHISLKDILKWSNVCQGTLWSYFSWRHFFIAVLLFLTVKRAEQCFRSSKFSMSCLLWSSDICCSVSPVQGPCNFTLQNQLFQRKFFFLWQSQGSKNADSVMKQQ